MRKRRPNLDWWYYCSAVLSDLESAHKLFQLPDTFNEFSGLNVNSSKTEGLWIGSLNDSESKPLGIKWPTEPIKALGVFFTYNQKLSHLKNFSEKIDDIKKLINIWSSRGLSIHGIVQHCGNTMSSDPVEVQFLFFWGGGEGGLICDCFNCS